jgi:hypothetical protein
MPDLPSIFWGAVVIGVSQSGAATKALKIGRFTNS